MPRNVHWESDFLLAFFNGQPLFKLTLEALYLFMLGRFRHPELQWSKGDGVICNSAMQISASPEGKPGAEKTHLHRDPKDTESGASRCAKIYLLLWNCARYGVTGGPWRRRKTALIPTPHLISMVNFWPTFNGLLKDETNLEVNFTVVEMIAPKQHDCKHPARALVGLRTFL